MGAKDSKPSFISYEDAVKRVSDSELRRIREAFKRCAGANGTALSLEAFVHEVLCDGVPYEVAEWLYQACGGTKRGIAFRELLCGLVVLTKGNIEEKIKFLWTLYTNNQGDNGLYIYKRDFTRTLHMENNSLPVTGAARSAEILLSLFGPADRVTFDQFRSWLLIHKDATVLSKWLLSDINVPQDIETPTFYQSLAGVTHLEERDIIELEKCFWSLRNAAPTGQLDIESLTPLLSPPLPSAAVAGTFLAFDENRDGHVDFKELCCGLSAACRGPKTERIKFCFKIFDLDSDGVLNKKELVDMVGILCTVANEHIKNNSSRASTPDNEAHETTEDMEKGFDPEVILLNLRDKLVAAPKVRKPIFQLGPSGESDEIIMLTETEEEGIISNDTVLTLEDFLIWCVESAESLVSPFLQVIFDVSHVVLGLRPQCRHHERDIVMGWLRREVMRGYSVGQFWYLISWEWWASWSTHVAQPCCRQRHLPTDEAIVCDESEATNSTDSVTESMGSLVWRLDTGSVGSATSSSGVSSALHHQHPGPVDNERLRQHDSLQVPTLTGEGGHLRRDITLSQHRDFELVPAALWRALALWYGAQDPLPRQVIRPANSEVELELYPLQLKIFRHVPSSRVSGAAALYGGVSSAGAPPERQLAYTAAFSRLATVKQVSEFICGSLGLTREHTRLWSLGASCVLLDDDSLALHELRLDGRLLLEIRNPDLTWPEEIGAIGLSGGGGGSARRATLAAPELPGATGLHNLGNTCFMNAALQSVWNTGPLTKYFNSGMHLYEVNTTNPLGTKGALALRFGELCKEVWSMRVRSVAPLRVRWAVCRHARALAGGGQHDAQELLAWLLDTLHEDLNRAIPRSIPSSPPDSAGRPDDVVAAEAWAAYKERNDSIITDLFYGQLKSRVRCEVCKTESVRFDAFNMLSLPLPMEAFVTINIKVILLDGSIPIKYGVRVNSEGNYAELKNKLSQLCGLEPDSILIVTMKGSLLGSAPSDNSRVSSSVQLTAYQLPPKHHVDTHHHHNGWSIGAECESQAGAGAGAEAGAAEVSHGRNTSSLCMPALFCFKRSVSELALSQSPPALLRAASHPAASHTRANTAPKELNSGDIPPSPTPSTRSLQLPPSPRVSVGGGGGGGSRVQFAPTSSTPSMSRLHDDASPVGGPHYLVAVHRKQVRWDAYFLPWQRSRPQVFGVPLLVPIHPQMSGHQLYAAVWTQVSRLLSARPPQAEGCNHATDCDDSLGYEFPFTLRAVNCSGAWCGTCPWPQLCRGCAIYADCCTEQDLVETDSLTSHTSISSGGVDTGSPIVKAKLQRQVSGRTASCHEGTVIPGTGSRLEVRALAAALAGGRRAALAVDWEPTALHLRYQCTREQASVEHGSVRRCSEERARAVDVVSCLRAFTRPETLEEPYHCTRCAAHQPATKVLQIWSLPPVLIIHLKRFQYVNNKWIKSQKVVNFPFENFDPTDYLASVPQETILRHRELSLKRRSVFLDEPISESEDEDATEDIPKERHKEESHNRAERRRKSIDEKRRERLESTSLMNTPVTDDNLRDYHQHPLLKDEDPFDLKYNLYAVVSHSGQLSGGHYVAYARNPAGTWLCYNDSMCRALAAAPTPPIDPAAAYILFYQRRGLDAERFLPDVTGRSPPPDLGPDPDENKACVIQ